MSEGCMGELISVIVLYSGVRPLYTYMYIHVLPSRSLTIHICGGAWWSQ